VLERDAQLEVSLIDAENITSADPYRVFIESLNDLAPVLNVRLDGIGDAVTPDVVMLLQGSVTDDYGVNRCWVDVVVNDEEPRQLPAALAGQELAEQLDFRKFRRDGAGLVLKPGDKLQLTAKAEDRCNLNGVPNLGVSDAYQVDVVKPETLLAMLETRELGLRQRFEQIIQEMKETRDSLLRIKSEGSQAARDLEESGSDEIEEQDEQSGAAGEEGEPDARLGSRAADVGKRAWSLRLLRGQRALLQSQKSAQETLGVAAAFRDIQLQLVNNRVDSEDRRQRLEDKVAAPLEKIGDTAFPNLEQLLTALIAVMDQIERSGGSQDEDAETIAATDAAVEQTNAILLEMDAVLENMMELEGYNELLDLVRSLIADQERLIEQTKSEQKRQILDLRQ
jgi:hypothetical protein